MSKDEAILEDEAMSEVLPAEEEFTELDPPFEEFVEVEGLLLEEEREPLDEEGDVGAVSVATNKNEIIPRIADSANVREGFWINQTHKTLFFFPGFCDCNEAKARVLFPSMTSGKNRISTPKAIKAIPMIKIKIMSVFIILILCLEV
jgi:hypothetical protein